MIAVEAAAPVDIPPLPVRLGSVKTCPHGCRKARCRECGGGPLCIHNRRKDHCAACHGCVHGKLKQRCFACGGRERCSHYWLKWACADCNNYTCQVDGCSLQGHMFCSKSALENYARRRHADEQ